MNPVSESSTLPRGARLGIDVGKVRVGLATSDPDGLIATPIETLARTFTPEPATDIDRIVAEVRDRGAKVVYIGLPRHMSGAEGQATLDARAYARSVARAVAPVSVRLVDERLTTVSAHRVLHAAGRTSRSHRAVVDQAAAVIILQTALETEQATRGRAGERVDERTMVEDHPADGSRSPDSLDRSGDQ